MHSVPVEGWSDCPPLCVDLDGTLVKSDTLADTFSQFVRRYPTEIWRLALWLGAGRARLKKEMARSCPLDVTRLPYNTPLLRYLQGQRREGRAIYLATGADGSLAERVSAHLGIFAGIEASDGITNLTGQKKLQGLKERFGAFDYVGNSRADLTVLAGARQALVANPTLGLRLGLRARKIPIGRIFTDRRPLRQTIVRALRVHQWAKNILLVAPLLMSHQLTATSLRAAGIAFVCFSLIASANYIANDMLDLESDRHHPAKRMRPFAAGDLSVEAGIGLAFSMLLISALLLALLPAAFDLWLLLYIAATSAYSLYLKRVSVVDVLVLSGLYTLRLLAGGAATGTPISPWLAGFSTFMFLSLAMVKRFSELEQLRERGLSLTHGRGYTVGDIEQVRSFGTASATAAVVVFMLYIARPDVTMLYQHGNRLWLIVPLLIYWLFRVWLLASRGELDDDPVIFAVQDRVSLLIGAAVILVAVLAI